MNIYFKLSRMSLQPCVGLYPQCGSLLVSITSKVWCPSASPSTPVGWALPSVCWEAVWSPAAASKARPRMPTTTVSTTPNRDPTPFRHPPITPKVHTFEMAYIKTPEDWKDHMCLTDFLFCYRHLKAQWPWGQLDAKLMARSPFSCHRLELCRFCGKARQRLTEMLHNKS